jgi:Xaa-Pro aminopeptidase
MTTLPFDAALLDRLLDEAGIDVLLATSKHNTQYLLGGYRFFFFDPMDAIGQSRYLPVVAYPRGRAEQTAYVGHPMERYEQELGRFWPQHLLLTARGSREASALAAGHVDRLGRGAGRIGVEMAFLPADALDTLRGALPQATFVDALVPLQRLRARKRPDELRLLREASERVIAAMLAVLEGHGPGSTKRQIVEALRREEVSRGLTFDYCLITAGSSLNRAPSDQRWEAGDILSLDSGGNYEGYIGDVCRMAVLGDPDAELEDLLAEVDAIQGAAMAPVRAGALGGLVYEGAEAALADTPSRARMQFLAHGMGLVSHEAPHLTGTGPVPYPATDAERSLEAGMVLSIETTLQHPRRGFIKLEDTVAVTEDGYEMLGAAGRGWNRGRA